MISLTYLSTATAPLGPSEVEALLVQSRELNALASVTGMLLYVDEHFIQTLEGGEDVVTATMDRIRADERHYDVAVTLVDEIERRYFPDWTMGCTVLTAAQAASVPGVNDFLDPGSDLYRETDRLGRAGVFHRIFRDAARLPS